MSLYDADDEQERKQYEEKYQATVDLYRRILEYFWRDEEK